MKGTELTDKQLNAAREFLLARARKTEIADDQQVAHSFEHLVRIVAWYGAIRFDACQRGIGTLTEPNPVGWTCEPEPKR